MLNLTVPVGRVEQADEWIEFSQEVTAISLKFLLLL